MGFFFFDQDGNVLTLLRPNTYAFASMLLMLVSSPENRTAATYNEMIREMTKEE